MLWSALLGGAAWAGATSSGVASSGGAASVQADFRGMLAAYWREYLELNPAVALAIGDTRHAERFDESLQEGWRTRMVAFIRRYRAASGAFDGEVLAGEDATSLAMLQEQLAQAQEYYDGPSFRTARMLAVDHFQGQHLAFASDAAAAGNFPFATVDDYAKALRRADGYARWTDDAIARLREGMTAGVVLPRMVVERVLPQLRVHFGRPAAETEFWQPIADMPAGFAAADRTRLARAYRRKIDEVIEPAYARLYAFLGTEYLPRARSSVGLGAIPGGAALYDHDVRYHTTTRSTPAAIHAVGLAEVARIEGEFARVQADLKIEGGPRALFDRVRADATQKFASRDEVLPAFEAARERIVSGLPALFDVMPRAQFQIRAMPDSARNSQGNGYYAPADAHGTRPGILWINTYAPGVSDRFNVMTITLHEGLPGHHLQTSLAQERVDLPAFRRFDFTNAYGEGWALYAESLGRDLGLYGDPWNYYGHLNYAILRANRLVVDTGLHAMGWDVERGVAWMMEHSSMTHDQAQAEVERYVAYPGQALAYKIGELKLRELRMRAEQALGGKFDVRAFHDQILLGGSMPLTILERRVDEWIAAARAR